MRKFISWAFVLAFLAGGVGLYITRPQSVDAASFDGLTGDADNGAFVFAATGCASCHSNPDSKEGLAGGHVFETDFGTFFAPNISQDPDHGIGLWSLPEFASALKHGTSPQGQHYYPAFPYTSYTLMTDQDIADLYAYLKTTAAEPTPSLAHDLGFPFNIRLSLGGWKLLFMKRDFVLDDANSEALSRGRYLVEAMGHCAECHTPRNALGGMNRSAWLAGGPNPDGKGRIPNITPSEEGVGAWSEDELVEYFATGFTPDFDVVGGLMVSVQENLAKLPESDLRAIAVYLKSIPPL